MSLKHIDPFADPTTVFAENEDFDHWCKFEDKKMSSQAGGCQELNNRIVWSINSDGPLSYSDAIKFCADKKEGGYKGSWRLPSRRDLGRIASLDDDNQSIARKYFNIPIPNFYWAQSSAKSKKASAVALNTGEAARIDKDDEESEVYGVCIRREKIKCAYHKHVLEVKSETADCHGREKKISRNVTVDRTSFGPARLTYAEAVNAAKNQCGGTTNFTKRKHLGSYMAVGVYDPRSGPPCGNWEKYLFTRTYQKCSIQKCVYVDTNQPASN